MSRKSADQMRASRGFAISRGILLARNPGLRSRTRLSWATIGHPCGVLNRRLRRIVFHWFKDLLYAHFTRTFWVYVAGLGE